MSRCTVCMEEYGKCDSFIVASGAFYTRKNSSGCDSGPLSTTTTKILNFIQGVIVAEELI